MRADRLLSELLLLQARGRLSAGELARELEVSERTIYRDMDALSASGVPVYAERGPGGGWALLDSYHTTLTGLTEDEVRALFMLSVPAPLADLGLSHELKAALLKLAAALPATSRGQDVQARQRVHLDSTPWFGTHEPPPYLQTIHEAIWRDQRLLLTYSLPFEARVERLVEPYGLVAKLNTWHLVYAWGGSRRVLPVWQVLEARLSGESFHRPADFDLASFWRDWCAAFEARRPTYQATLRMSPGLATALPAYLGDVAHAALAAAAPPDPAGWITLTLPFESLEEARSRLLGFGGAVEVLAPAALRKSLLDFAQQAVRVYQKNSM